MPDTSVPNESVTTPEIDVTGGGGGANAVRSRRYTSCVLAFVSGKTRFVADDVKAILVPSALTAISEPVMKLLCVPLVPTLTRSVSGTDRRRRKTSRKNGLLVSSATRFDALE